MWTVFWHSVLLASVGTLIIRLGGRKSIAQMTTPQFAVLLTIGSILGSEVAGKGLAQSILSVATFVAFLVVTEWISLHWNRAETALNRLPNPPKEEDIFAEVTTGVHRREPPPRLQ